MVSVVVPVRNDPAGIQGCVEALRRQSYPADRLQIVVVDNDSSDHTFEVISRLGVRALRESSGRNSYLARNRGVSESTGEIIAFTDADCTPSERWVEAGVHALRNLGADLVGGHVRFQLGDPPTGAEIWDSITNMQIADNIQERGVAKTANLFAYRHVLESVGPFPVAAPSGGDVAWTADATRAGYTLVYAAEAEVLHPARRLAALVRKQLRVGIGQAALLGPREGSRHACQLLTPLRPSLLAAQVRRKGRRLSRHQFVRLWTAASICRAANAAGIFWSLSRLSR